MADDGSFIENSQQSLGKNEFKMLADGQAEAQEGFIGTQFKTDVLGLEITSAVNFGEEGYIPEMEEGHNSASKSAMTSLVNS